MVPSTLDMRPKNSQPFLSRPTSFVSLHYCSTSDLRVPKVTTIKFAQTVLAFTFSKASRGMQDGTHRIRKSHACTVHRSAPYEVFDNHLDTNNHVRRRCAVTPQFPGNPRPKERQVQSASRQRTVLRQGLPAWYAGFGDHLFHFMHLSSIDCSSFAELFH